jgi:hypothetical protein
MAPFSLLGHQANNWALGSWSLSKDEVGPLEWLQVLGQRVLDLLRIRLKQRRIIAGIPERSSHPRSVAVTP